VHEVREYLFAVASSHLVMVLIEISVNNESKDELHITRD
jgi:hypothetical protein